MIKRKHYGRKKYTSRYKSKKPSKRHGVRIKRYGASRGGIRL